MSALWFSLFNFINLFSYAYSFTIGGIFVWSYVWNEVEGRVYTPGDVQMVTFGFVFAVFCLTMVAPNLGLVTTGKLSAGKLLKVIN